MRRSWTVRCVVPGLREMLSRVRRTFDGDCPGFGGNILGSRRHNAASHTPTPPVREGGRILRFFTRAGSVLRVEVRGRTTVGGGGVLHGPASGLTRPEVEGCTFGAVNGIMMEDSGESRYCCISEVGDVGLKMDSSRSQVPRYACVSEVNDVGL